MRDLGGKKMKGGRDEGRKRRREWKIVRIY